MVEQERLVGLISPLCPVKPLPPKPEDGSPCIYYRKFGLDEAHAFFWFPFGSTMPRVPKEAVEAYVALESQFHQLEEVAQTVSHVFDAQKENLRAIKHSLKRDQAEKVRKILEVKSIKNHDRESAKYVKVCKASIRKLLKTAIDSALDKKLPVFATPYVNIRVVKFLAFLQSATAEVIR